MEASLIGTILGVAIGIVFVFMLFSLFLSSLLEAVSALLKLRGRALRIAIARMVDDPAHPVRFGGFGFFDQVAARVQAGKKGAAAAQEPPLRADPVNPDAPELHEGQTETPHGEYLAPQAVTLHAVFRHPLIAGSKEDTKPSYVPPANFTSALVHAMLDGRADMSLPVLQARVDVLPAGMLRDAVQTALREANNDIEAFKRGIERWYDQSMARLSGEYKRFSQAVTFIIGFGLAVAYDIDPIMIGQRLYADPVMREAVVQQANAYVEEAAQAQAAAASAAGVASAPSFDARLKAVEQAKSKLLDTGLLRLNRPEGEAALPLTASMLLGWLLTGLAGMLGAPFWFDLLQRMVNLRGAGPKPAASTTKE